MLASTIAPALFSVSVSQLDSTDSILVIVLSIIHGSMRQHNKIKAFLCVLCAPVVKYFLKLFF